MTPERALPASSGQLRHMSKTAKSSIMGTSLKSSSLSETLCHKSVVEKQRWGTDTVSHSSSAAAQMPKGQCTTALLALCQSAPINTRPLPWHAAAQGACPSLARALAELPSTGCASRMPSSRRTCCWRTSSACDPPTPVPLSSSTSCRMRQTCTPGRSAHASSLLLRAWLLHILQQQQQQQSYLAVQFMNGRCRARLKLSTWLHPADRLHTCKPWLHGILCWPACVHHVSTGASLRR